MKKSQAEANIDHLVSVLKDQRDEALARVSELEEEISLLRAVVGDKSPTGCKGGAPS